MEDSEVPFETWRDLSVRTIAAMAKKNTIVGQLNGFNASGERAPGEKPSSGTFIPKMDMSIDNMQRIIDSV